MRQKPKKSVQKSVHKSVHHAVRDAVHHDEDEHLDGVDIAVDAIAPTSALNSNVLVLNRFYQAIRIVNVRRAFAMLCKDLAEVIHIDVAADGSQQWSNLDFSSWQEMSELRREF